MAGLTSEQREANRLEHERREEIYRMARENECSECGRGLTVVVEDGLLKLRCPTSRDHCGIRKLRSLSQRARSGEYIPYVSERVERRKQERMEEKMAGNSQALALAQQQERGIITREAATAAIEALWPKAGLPARTQALMICMTHNLNPLDGEVFIVQYRQKDGPPRDVVILGIPGVRKIARERTPYTYVDGPRVMPAEEQEDILGEVHKDKVVVTVTLKTPKGGRFPGYGFWPRGVDVQGADKGNTKFNMASYRAERNALKRIMPDEELPAPVGMVVQGVYTDAADSEPMPMLTDGEVDPETGEITPVEAQPEGDWSRSADSPEPDTLKGEIDEIMELKDKAGISDAKFEAAIAKKFEGKQGVMILTAEERVRLKGMLLDAIAARAA